MSEYSYSLSGKIRQYMSGLLLLALAGFIITAVENIVASIPDSELSIGNNVKAYFFGPAVSDHWYGTIYYSQYAPLIGSPPDQGYKYVIVFKVELHPYHNFEIFHSIEISDGTEWYYYGYEELDECCRHPVNNSDYYFIEWDKPIMFINIYSNYIAYSEKVYIYIVPSDTSIPFPLDQPAQTQNGNATSISLKTFLKFISWIATAFIVITALHKFDIYI